MENQNEALYQVVVHNRVKDGYRRAGFALQKGPNLLMNVTEAQIAALQADERLTFGSRDPMPTETEKEAEEKALAALTVEQLKEKLAAAGIEAPKEAKKADLIALLKDAK